MVDKNLNMISISNLSKQYRVGEIAFRRLSDDITTFLYKIFKKENPNSQIKLNTQESISKTNKVWALKNINLDVKKGEVLGIIGKNGAGKSTLLKILSRITGPTSGEIKIWGKISSLLEVGTGFHPELTGKENIFLNGTILGLSRIDIEKINAIISYSEIENILIRL